MVTDIWRMTRRVSYLRRRNLDSFTINARKDCNLTDRIICATVNLFVQSVLKRCKLFSSLPELVESACQFFERFSGRVRAADMHNCVCAPENVRVEVREPNWSSLLVFTIATVAAGYDGTGVKVGVLSYSASPARVAALIASGDLPANTVVLSGQAGPSNGEDEGTAMMEIVHDLAPGAQPYFATAFNGEASFAANIIALQAAGCKVIVDDVTYFDEGVFQDGPIAQAVNQVTAAGVTYFSSAANSGNLTSSTSGTWEGDFLNGGAVNGTLAAAGETGSFHNFGTAASPQNFDVLTTTTDFISLKWSDPLGASSNDYDLFILNSRGTNVKGFSASAQNGTEDPFEFVEQGNNCWTASASGYCPAGGDALL